MSASTFVRLASIGLRRYTRFTSPTDRRAHARLLMDAATRLYAVEAGPREATAEALRILTSLRGDPQ